MKMIRENTPITGWYDSVNPKRVILIETFMEMGGEDGWKKNKKNLSRVS